MIMTIWKKWLLCLWIVCAFLYLHADDADVAVKKLEERGEYSLASTILKNKLNGTYEAEHFKELFSFNERLINFLKKKHTRNGLSLFVVPDKDGIIERNKDRTWYEWTGSVISWIGSAFGGPGMAAAVISEGGVQIWLNKKATDKQRSALRSIDNPLIQADDAISVLNAYDTAKGNAQYMDSLLSQEVARNPSNIDNLLNLVNSVRKQEEELKTDRTAYLSFTVISPYIWEACRQIFLADSDYFALQGRDKEVLDKAAAFLAKSCHKKWLYQADESLRLQFADAQKVFKEVASKTELEYYKVLSTFQDSNDPSKRRGAEYWWFEE